MRKGFPTVLVFLLLVLSMLSSCERGTSKSVEHTPLPSPTSSALRVELSAAQEPSPPPQPSQETGEKGLTMRSPAPSLRPSSAPQPARVPREHPFLQHLRESVLATDTYIGPLPGRIAPSSPEEAARRTAQAFSTRRLPPEIQDEGVRQHVLRTLAYMDRLGVSVTGVRIGLAFPDASGLFHVNIKLYLQEGYVGGSLVLKKQDAGWVVSDLLLDTASFLSPETEERPFAPGGYAMLPLY